MIFTSYSVDHGGEHWMELWINPQLLKRCEHIFICLSVCQSVCLSVCLSPPYPPPPPPPLQPFCSSYPLLGLSNMFLDQASLLGRGLDRGQCPVEHSGEILSVHLSMYMSLRTFSPSWEAGPGCSKAIKKLAQSPIGSTALPSRRSNVSKWAGQGYRCSYDAFG